MTTEFLILLGVFIAGFAAVVWFVLKKQGSSGSDAQGLLMLQNQMNEIVRTLDTKLSESTKAIQDQFGQSAKIITNVTERLTKLDETNRQVLNFSDQLQQLQDILKNPKQRGILGEYYLESLLKNVMPPGSYELQYKFSDGDIVDAAIFIKERVIPVDAKFSLENYNRIVEERNDAEREKLEKIFRQDLKNRIDETAKYVKPEQGTMEFAFMFIPAEAIYYDLLVNKIGAVKVNTQDLIQYAFNEKKVIIVSPTSFLAYLQTVLQALRALQIEDSAKEIRKYVGQLERHIRSYDDYMQKMGTHLGTTVNMYNRAYGELKKTDKDWAKITGGEMIGIEAEALERPRPPEELD